jgi:hypothetical protein
MNWITDLILPGIVSIGLTVLAIILMWVGAQMDPEDPPTSTFASLNFWASVTWQAAFASLLGWALHLLIGWDWMAYALGVITILVAVGYTPWVNKWFIRPKLNHIAVLEYSTRGKKTPRTDLEIVKPQSSLAVRTVTGPMLDGTTPFMSIANNKVINTARSVPLRGTTKILTADGVPLLAHWYMALSAIGTPRGAILLSQLSPTNIESTNSKRNEGFLQNKARELTLDKILSGLYVEEGKIKAVADEQGKVTVQSTDQIEGAFSKINGGKDKISEFEWEMATYTGDPLVSIELDPELTKAFKAKLVAQQTAAAIKVYTHPDVGLDVKAATNMVATDRGQQQPIRLLEIVGLEPGSSFYYGDTQPTPPKQ